MRRAAERGDIMQGVAQHSPELQLIIVKSYIIRCVELWWDVPCCMA